MTTLPKDFKEFIALLNKHDVRYIVIDDVSINIIDLENLIKAKKASNRVRDLADIEELT